MGQLRNGVGTFLTRKMAAQTVRQRHGTGPQFNGRTHFRFPNRFKRLHLRQYGLKNGQEGFDKDRPETWHANLEGVVSEKKPEQTWFDTDRVDKVVCRWEKQGRLQVYNVGGKTESFVCYRCGYPVKSKLVAIKDDNWDYRMCYNCYTTTCRDGMENDT